MFRRGNPFVHAREETSSTHRAFPILAFTHSHSTKPVEILSTTFVCLEFFAELLLFLASASFGAAGSRSRG